MPTPSRPAPPAVTARPPNLLRRLPAAVVTVFALLLPLSPPAAAWSGAGHRLVAEAAEARLSSASRARVQALLALEDAPGLAAIAAWADETRSPETQRWHYLNFERIGRGAEGCRYEAARHCPDGQCVVGAIEQQAALLADTTLPAPQRLMALKYLVHFVADVHQPLHAGFADDRGGNRFQLRWQDQGSNLHALWDHGLLEAAPGGLPGLRERLLRRPGPRLVDSAPAGWAEQSCRIVARPGFYPEGPAARDPGPAYAAAWAPVLAGQLDLAAWRLALLLERLLGGELSRRPVP